MVSTKVMLVMSVYLSTVVLTHSMAVPISDSNDFELNNSMLTLEVLEELADRIRTSVQFNPENKRNENTEYARYGRHGVGSKLLALKQAADWNGPGRKKRSTILE